MKREWSRAKIVDALIELDSAGVSLRQEAIRNRDEGLAQIMYYKKPDGKRKYFESLKSARAAVAKELRRRGDKEASKRVLDYNKPQESPTKLSEEDIEQRKKDLISRLNQKIADGEDISYRYQQKVDRPFVSMCCRTFGKYRNSFEAAGLDYLKHARHEKKGKARYMEEFLGHILDGKKLDRESMEGLDKSLVERLDDYYGGYYGALTAAKKELEQQDEELAEKVDVEYWRTFQKKRREKNRRKRIRRALKNMNCIDRDKVYTSKAIPIFEFDGKLSGAEIQMLFQESPDWLTGGELASRLGTTQPNLKNHLLAFRKHMVRYQEGGRHNYWYNAVILDNFQRKSRIGSPEGSIQAFANDLGVGYSKMRWVMSNLGFDPEVVDRVKLLSETEKEMITEVVERERRILATVIKSVEPEKYYSFTDLEKMAVPTSHLSRMTRKGKIAYRLKKGARAISGADALEYFHKSGKNLRLSQGLGLIAYFRPELYTMSETVALLGVERSKLHSRVSELEQENANACFRIRKSEERSRILITRPALTYLRRWQVSRELQLLDVLNRERRKVTKEQVKDAVKSIDSLLESKEVPHYSEIDEWMETLQVLKDYEYAESAQKDIYRVYNYMLKNNYLWLDLDKRFSLDEVCKMIRDPVLIQGAGKRRKQLEWTLMQSNMGLVYRVAKQLDINKRSSDRFGRDYDAVIDSGKDALLNAIIFFDTSSGNKLSSYAFSAVRNEFINRVFAKKKVRTVSYNKKIGDGKNEMLDLFSDKQEYDALDKAADARLKEDISGLLKILNPKKREIIRRRFGIGCERDVLREIGKDMGVSRERIRQLETEALHELREDPRMDKLIEWLM